MGETVFMLNSIIIQGQRDRGSTTNPSDKQPNPNTTPVIYGLVPTDFFSFVNMSDGGSKKSGS